MNHKFYQELLKTLTFEQMIKTTVDQVPLGQYLARMTLASSVKGNLALCKVFCKGTHRLIEENHFEWALGSELGKETCYLFPYVEKEVIIKDIDS